MSEKYILRKIPGFNHYFITINGRVFSNMKRKSDKQNSTPPLRKLSTDFSFGYRTIKLFSDGKEHKRFIHRLVLETFFGPCPKGMQCRHIDGNKLNNHYKNLKWGTCSENQLDRATHGTSNRGEQHGNCKLSVDDVVQIRIFAREFGYKKTAKMFEISPTNVGHIVRRESWAWL